MSQMSLEPSLKVAPQEFVIVEVQPTMTSVLSSAIKDLALALIGRAESNLSRRCMRRLAEVTEEHNKASKQSHIQRCFQRLAQALSGSRSTLRSL